ncbi:MAG: hypothetical protein ACOH2O_18160 [Pseudomonas sp.]
MNGPVDSNSPAVENYFNDPEALVMPVAGPPKVPKIKPPAKKDPSGGNTSISKDKPKGPSTTPPVFPDKPKGPPARPPMVSDKPKAPPAKPQVDQAGLPTRELPEKPAPRSTLESVSTAFDIAANAFSIASSIKDLSTGQPVPIAKLADGTVVNNETSTVTLPDGKVIDDAKKTVTHPDGSKQYAEGTTEYPDGSIKDSAGDIKYPDGRWYYSADKVMRHVDGTFEYDDGTVIDADGKPVGKRA